MMATVGTAAATGVDYGGCAGTVPERMLPADPDDYLAVLAGAGPGDLVQLAAGTYGGGLPLAGVNGEPDRCIVIEGPAAGPPALFEGLDCYNVISLANSSYLVVRQLEIDGMDRLGDGVRAEGTPAPGRAPCPDAARRGRTQRGREAPSASTASAMKRGGSPGWNR
jgi:hypothetical protein